MDTISQNLVCNSNICYHEANDKVLSCNDIEKLSYEIYRYSSFSTNYFPENILVDDPSDQSSRWSASTNNPPQYLTLKLRRPAIVKSIKFGKFEKSHVCNIKKFRVYGGLEEGHMHTLLLEGGLKNDNKPETFSLRCVTEDGTENLPILFIKIVPLLSWGPTFNFSIWYIELHGQDDPMFTNASMKSYNMHREAEIIRLCLKHFRQQGYEDAFRALQEQTQVQLEDPLISDLHEQLVTHGDFKNSEKIIEDFLEKGLMDSYLQSQDYRHSWNLQEIQSGDQPSNRGGHQLVMDTKRRLIYLYGGWDGYQNLSDLWLFDIEKSTWTQLFADTEFAMGPSPRSCHKMVFDPISKSIFMIGRYLDNSIRVRDFVKSDFFLYDTQLDKWLKICDDTSQVGGPQLVYDHQMCIDAEKRTIYVFGGKIVTPRSVTTTTNDPEYSGLFSYHIDTNCWQQIMVDCHHPSAAKADVLSIKSRVTHCMVFHTRNRKLYIYGGNRGKDDIEDFITYDVDTQAIAVINKGLYKNTVGETEPSPGYTLRATIDCDRDEIYVFSSLSKLKDRRDIQSVDPSNSFWVYSLKKNEWTRIYNCRQSMDSPNAGEKLSSLEPCPRFAHQLVYDDVAKVHYLFGGNPGRPNLPQLRLDDFWTLSLEKPKREELLAECRYLIRKLHYEEIARIDKLKAMKYLRTQIAEVIDHSDQVQLSNFHKLAYLLFKPDDSDADCFMRDPSILGVSPLPHANIAIQSKDDTSSSALTSTMDDESQLKTDSEGTNHADDISMESNESTVPPINNISSNVDESAYKQYLQIGGKRSYQEFLQEVKARRVFLFNRLVRLMPANMVQPDRNLSDFVVM